jgi:hypothetical protein
MSRRFEILVDGIDDPSIVADIQKKILDSFQEMALPGAWRVVVKASCVSGRWEFTVHGLDARHTLSIAVPPTLLANLIPHRLRESFDHRALRAVPDFQFPR